MKIGSAKVSKLGSKDPYMKGLKQKVGERERESRKRKQASQAGSSLRL